MAIVLGWITDIVGTMVFASIVFVIIGSVLGGSGSTPADLAAFERSGAWQAFGLIFGMSFTALGRYLTARIANYSEYRFAAMMGLLSLVSGELLMQLGDGDSSMFWVRMVGFVFTIPAALFGAWYYLQTKNAVAAP